MAGGGALELLRIAGELQARSLSFDACLQELASALLRIAIAQTAPEALDKDLPDRDRTLELASRIDPESTQLFYQIATQGREDLHLAPDEHAGFVMTLLRMLAFRPEGGVAESLLPSAQHTATAAPARSAAAGSAAAAAASPASRPRPASGAFDGDWPKLYRELEISGAAKELARNAEFVRFEEGCFDLIVPKSMPHLAEATYREKLRVALQQRLGEAVRVKVSTGEVRGASVATLEANDQDAKRAEAARSVQGDRFVNDLVNLLDGRVVEQSVRPARNNE